MNKNSQSNVYDVLLITIVTTAKLLTNLAHKLSIGQNEKEYPQKKKIFDNASPWLPPFAMAMKTTSNFQSMFPYPAILVLIFFFQSLDHLSKSISSHSHHHSNQSF